MTVAVEAIYENGVLRPEKPLGFKEHARVRVIIEDESEARTSEEGGSDLGAWRNLIGIIKDAPPDVSENHDKYLYGDPSK
jgi:predicted DNA-binding antitoxin AbrB/MazE fold protein